jgi:hypothetical protein
MIPVLMHLMHWQIQRWGVGDWNPFPFIRKFCQNRVKITHFESGIPLKNPQIVVERPFENQN